MLQMYEEKAEEAEELKLDIQDLKANRYMYVACTIHVVIYMCLLLIKFNTVHNVDIGTTQIKYSACTKAHVDTGSLHIGQSVMWSYAVALAAQVKEDDIIRI